MHGAGSCNTIESVAALAAANGNQAGGSTPGIGHNSLPPDEPSGPSVDPSVPAIVVRALKNGGLGALEWFLTFKSPGVGAVSAYSDILNDPFTRKRPKQSIYETKGRSIDEDWSKLKELCPSCVSGNKITYDNGAVHVIRYIATRGGGPTLTFNIYGTISKVRY